MEWSIFLNCNLLKICYFYSIQAEWSIFSNFSLNVLKKMYGKKKMLMTDIEFI